MRGRRKGVKDGRGRHEGEEKRGGTTAEPGRNEVALTDSKLQQRC